MANKPHLSASLTGKQKLFGSFYLAVQFLVLPTVLYQVAGQFFPGTTDAALNFLYYLINFFAIICIFRSFLKKNWHIVTKNLLRVLQYALLGLAGYWASNVLLAELTTTLMPEFSNVNDSAIAAISRDGYLLMTIGTVLLVPTAEECLFRGLLFRGVYSKSRWAAYATSVISFSFIHIFGYIGNYDLPLLALCFVQYLPAGLILAWSYEKSNTIFTPILIHTVINAIGIYSMR